MAILVVCPGCRKRFQVSDQFGGRTGPCPSCKTPIQIPKADAVVIHEPEQYQSGGKSATGEMVLKPIGRTDVKFDPVKATIVGAVVVLVLVLAYLGRGVIAGPALLSRLIQAIGLLLVTPPLVVAGYSFLRNDELEPYRGKELYLRAGALSLAYCILWGIFGLTPVRDLLADPEMMWMWAVVATPLLVIGSLGALAALDLDFGSGLFHYAFYLVVTMLLGWAAGLGWPWQIAMSASAK